MFGVGASRQAAALRRRWGRRAQRPCQAGRGDGCGGRCCAPTSLRCSSRGRAAKLAALASRAPLGQSPRVRSTKRASRADPETALLGTAEIAPARLARPLGAWPPTAPQRCRLPLWKRGRSTRRRRPCSSPEPSHRQQRRRLPAAGAPCAQPRSAAVPARARSAPRTSDSPRLSERSARSARSEFRGGAGTASIAGHPRVAGASTRGAGGGRPATLPAPLVACNRPRQPGAEQPSGGARRSD